MKTETFPINYFKSIWTPVQAFKNRQKLGWPGIIVVLVFLNALMTIPVTLNFAQMDTFPLEQVYPNAMEMVAEQPVAELHEAEYENGQMNLSAPFLLATDAGVLAGGLNQEEAEQVMEEETVVLFEEDHLLIKEDTLPVSTIPYTTNFSLEEAETGASVVDELSRQWFTQNQVFIVGFFSLLISVFLFVMLFFLVFGSAVFLYLTKKSTFTSISTYKESVNLLLNVLALPTVAAMIFGLIQFDIIWMLMIQTIGLVILLLVIYFKTHFNDETLNTVVQE